MGQLTYRANLSAPTIPFTVASSGRHTIYKQYDQNYVPPMISDKDLDKDIGVPQAIYAHNILPTGDGYQAVDFNLEVYKLAGDRTFVQVVSVRDVDGNVAYIGLTTEKKLYYYRPPFFTWNYLYEFASDHLPTLTAAQVSGVSYIFASNWNCYTYNFTNNTLEEAILNGVEMLDIIGITSVQGYLIAYSTDSVAWGSLLDPTDMEPSLATGAGGGTVEQIRGKIVSCVYNITGFIIYTTANAVVAVYSGNEAFPFNFREINNSGGILNTTYVANEANSGTHYAFTTSGLQQITAVETKSVFPELTDFLTSKIFEDFDPVTRELIHTELTTPLAKRIAFIADRYLVLSYGASSLTHMIVYDSFLERFGKLKVPHVSVFEWAGHATVDADVTKTSFGILRSDGSVLTVNFTPAAGTWAELPAASRPVLLLGRYQFVRSNFIQLDRVEVETTYQSDDYDCYALPSLDGKNFSTPVLGIENVTSDYVRNFFFKAAALNFSVLLAGKFNLSTLILHLSVHGER